ncbi:nucleotide exchange factor sil1 [Scheffersomyces spartinae]|uniref:Nucleotide exchange factor SIL1 n=1 Tax=Scheffersomyces spartinae TaxID=45513 RepID=A0A9P7V942_9ASCO|nr:nucleotide exchange factor sil1 [Scheffersomyces spartinae]KAG7193675.1 nucleotide exchange factor sil1 [Scheffersomyces spartinae]
MKWSYLLCSILLGGYLVASAASVAQTICNPQDPSDCYSKIFVPSHEFQVIRPGQELPLGLHIRMNLDTGLKEAKFDDSPNEGEVAVVEADGEELIIPEDSLIADLDDEEERYAQEDAEVNHLKQQANQNKAIGVDIQGILNFKGKNTYNALITSLNSVEESSHDVEIGEELMANNQLVNKLNEIVANNQYDYELIERIYRIFASSLRNNPNALEKFLERPQYVAYVNSLFDSLSEGQPDVIQKRILGIVQALLGSDKFRHEYFQGNGLNRLIRAYNYLGSQAKARVVNIFEDLDLITNVSNVAGNINSNGLEGNNKKRSQVFSIDMMASGYLQKRLMSGDLSFELFKELFQNLNDLHNANKELLPSPEFLQWLTGELDRRSNLKERDEESLEFDREMLKARHLIYGNPKALRKAYADEL